tara:strand:- start:3283 stop:3753 length:471 start_codon:yes stop_codon:yes gene_type:complete
MKTKRFDYFQTAGAEQAMTEAIEEFGQRNPDARNITGKWLGAYPGDRDGRWVTIEMSYEDGSELEPVDVAVNNVDIAALRGQRLALLEAIDDAERFRKGKMCASKRAQHVARLDGLVAMIDAMLDNAELDLVIEDKERVDPLAPAPRYVGQFPGVI